jgi:hypothetical protein
MPWFHGGIPGLNVGDELLPPSQTGKPTLLDYSREFAANTQRDDRVYLTRDPKAAALYAFGYPRGDVYEAEPTLTRAGPAGGDGRGVFGVLIDFFGDR